MAKYVCSVCGYVHEGDQPPEKCPQCGVGPEKFNKMEEGEKVWAAEHVVGVAKGVSEDIVADLRANFEGECSEVGMYLAKDIRKSAFTGKKQLMKRQSMRQNLQNCLVK